jgi:hypothetical protein
LAKIGEKLPIFPEFLAGYNPSSLFMLVTIPANIGATSLHLKLYHGLMLPLFPSLYPSKSRFSSSMLACHCYDLARRTLHKFCQKNRLFPSLYPPIMAS